LVGHWVRAFSGNSSKQIINILQSSKEIVTMRSLFAKLAGFCTLTVSVFMPGWALAAGGGQVAPLVIVADTRKLTGLFAWWANLYNESHVQFTILTIVLIPLIGVIFGVLADIVMSRIGIDLKSRDLAEH
jgi:hypothetical protein